MSAIFKLTYGLFVLSAKDGDKDNGCIINTALQVTDSPLQLSITLNKANYTHEMIKKTGKFNLSVLSQETPFSVFQHFGMQSGKDVNKFAGKVPRTENGIVYVEDVANAVLSVDVNNTVDVGTHTIFIGELTEDKILSDVPSASYQYYFDHIKPKPEEKKKGYICKICGYVYEGEKLPEDFVCPVCKHGAIDFEPL